MDRYACAKADNCMSTIEPDVSDRCDRMSDMAPHRITIRVPETLEASLRRRSRVNGQTPSDLVRLALKSYLSKQGNAGSAYEIAQEAGLIGCGRRAPQDP